MKKIVTLIAILALTAVLSTNALAAGALGGTVQTLHAKKQFTLGATYFGYQAGGPNFTGSYYISDNLAVEGDIGFLRNVTNNVTTGFTYYSLMGVYHAALTDLIGAYAGIGFDFATFTPPGFAATTVSGVGYTVGAEVLLTNNLYGKAGIRSGVFEIGLETSL